MSETTAAVVFVVREGRDAHICVKTVKFARPPQVGDILDPVSPDSADHPLPPSRLKVVSQSFNYEGYLTVNLSDIIVATTPEVQELYRDQKERGKVVFWRPLGGGNIVEHLEFSGWRCTLVD